MLLWLSVHIFNLIGLRNRILAFLIGHMVRATLSEPHS